MVVAVLSAFSSGCGRKQSVNAVVEIPVSNGSTGEFSWYSPTIHAVEHALVKYRNANGKWALDDHELINGAPIDVHYEGPKGEVVERLVAPGFTAKLERFTPAAAIYHIKFRSEEIDMMVTDEDWWWTPPPPKSKISRSWQFPVATR